MSLMTCSSTRRFPIIGLSLCLSFTIACNTEAPPSNSAGGDQEEIDTTGGTASTLPEDEGGARPPSGGETSMGGASAGGEMGGADIIVGGTSIEGGEEVHMGRIDPNAPLPTPTHTTLSPPAEIDALKEAPMIEGCQGVYMTEIRGWVVDEVGAPLEAAKVQVCVRVYPSGELLCLMPGDTRANGYFSVEIPESARCMSEATLRTLIPREAFASMYCHTNLSDLSEDTVLRLHDPIVLYETRPAISIDESTGADERSLTLMGDLTLTADPDTIYGPTFEEISGRPVPVDAPGLCFLDSESAEPEEEPTPPMIDGVFTFYPEGDIVDAVATLTFPNTAGAPPMSEVALYTLGNLDCSILGQVEGLEEGDWAQFGVGVVDEGGMWVEVNIDNGLPCLSWFGYGPANTP